MAPEKARPDTFQSVGPAPPPVQADLSSEPIRRKPNAISAPAYFRRHLPHFEGRGGPLIITFSTRNRWVLPETVRPLVLASILHDHPSKMELISAVVMPDHVHMLYLPASDSDGTRYSKTEIVGSIKSASAHAVNKSLNRKGPVWQDESFDHVVRKAESAQEKAEYISPNPVRAGLCVSPDEYPYLWRGWVEGRTAKPKSGENA